MTLRERLDAAKAATAYDAAERPALVTGEECARLTLALDTLEAVEWIEGCQHGGAQVQWMALSRRWCAFEFSGFDETGDSLPEAVSSLRQKIEKEKE